jgi:hypothetical protein
MLVATSDKIFFVLTTNTFSKIYPGIVCLIDSVTAEGSYENSKICDF